MAKPLPIMFPSRWAALRAGATTTAPIRVRTITSGPFKGRAYEVLPNGRLGRRVAVLGKEA